MVTMIVYVEKTRPVAMMPIHTQFLNQRTEPNTVRTKEKRASFRIHQRAPSAIQNPSRLYVRVSSCVQLCKSMPYLDERLGHGGLVDIPGMAARGESGYMEYELLSGGRSS
jgi:hypothetical protein